MSMDVTITQAGETARVTACGRLNTSTASQLEEAVEAIVETAHDIEFDFGELEYISSAGLRVLLATSKMLAPKGGAIRRIKANESVREVFEVTGFVNLFEVV